MENLVSEPIKVGDVYKDTPSQDGFYAKLEGGEVVSISNTYWQSAEYVEQVEDGVVLSTPKGKIYFNKDLLEKITSL